MEGLLSKINCCISSDLRLRSYRLDRLFESCWGTILALEFVDLRAFCFMGFANIVFPFCLPTSVPLFASVPSLPAFYDLFHFDGLSLVHVSFAGESRDRSGDE